VTSIDATLPAGPAPAARPEPGAIAPRPAGFLNDVSAIAGRALRGIPRDLESVIPSVFIPLFFFVVNVGALQNITESQAPPGFDFKAFQLPIAVIFGITGVSRAPTLVTDIQDGYFDRLLLTPVRRLAILLGLMVADLALACALTLPVIGVGLALGVRFDSGPLGILAFIAILALWGLAFTGFPYAIALKTGNPAAVNTSFLLFFPFAFLTSAFVPRDEMTGWLDVIAGWNPVTYLLEGLRSLVMEGWQWADLGRAVAAVAVVAALSMSLCFAALRGRVRRS